MKQKNMVLMAVAVGCGLVAAFLTSKLGAGNKTGDTVEVLVAKKEIKIGTLLDEKDFNDLLTKAPYPAGTLPPDVITNPEELKGRRLSRTLRAGNYFSPGDVSGQEGIPLPQGTYMYAVRLDAVRASAGFIMPGSKVEVLALQKHPTDGSRVRSRLILSDMLVVAVDINDRRPEGGGAAIPTISSVSLAVTAEQGKLLHNCESTGGEIRLLLRGPLTPSGSNVKVDDWYDYSDLFNDNRNKGQAQGPETVQIAYAKQDIPPGTKISAANLGEYFELRAYLAPAPAKAIKDLSELKGKWTRFALSGDLPVLESALSDDEPAPASPPEVRERIVEKEVPGKAPAAAGPEKDKNAKHDLIIISGQETKKYRYEGKTNDSLKLKGSVDDKAADEDEKKEPAKPAEPAKPSSGSGPSV